MSAGNGNEAWPPPRPSIGTSIASDSTNSELIAHLPTMLSGFGVPGFVSLTFAEVAQMCTCEPSSVSAAADSAAYDVSIIQIFPQILSKLAKYPKLSKVFSLVFTLVLTSYLGATKATELLSAGWSSIVSLFASSVTINGDDPVVQQIQTWLRRKKLRGIGSNFNAESSYQILKRSQEECDDDDYDDFGDPVEKNTTKEEKPFRMVLHSKRTIHLFRHGGRMFLIRKERGEGTYDPGSVTNLTFYCLGWSTKPIIELVNEIDKSQKVVKQEERWTTIRASNEENHYGQWSQPRRKMARPLSTVDLDEGQKELIAQDIAEYLDPETKAWYQQQGIPYRRGYLFYGPPGTGKSSLAMALAGQFNMDIYVISLLDKNLNDYTLCRLFKSMVGTPLVLLEDVDSAGISRDFEDSDDDDSDDDYHGRRHRKRKSQVTLSGLLNALDGVSAPEGHLVIMTTNHIEALDDALIRAGRVDVRIKLAWCSRSQIRDIFLRMYSLILRGTRTKQCDQCEVDQRSPEGLQMLAEKFSNQIPEYQISPAELQDFILMRKSSPERAVSEVKAWADKLICERREAEAAEEKRRNKADKKRRKIRKQLAGLDDEDQDTTSEEDTENGEGKQTPPPSFEDVEAEKKEGLLRWLVKQIVNGPEPIQLPAEAAQEA